MLPSVKNNASAANAISEEKRLNLLSALFPVPSERDYDTMRRFLLDGVVEAKGFGEVQINYDLWACGPQDDRTWLWTLHAFLPLDPLIVTGEVEVIDALVRSWRAQFENAPVEDDFPWHDHATALRLDRLSRMAVTLPGCRYASLAARHAEILLKETFYSRRTNHGFDQAVSLILASLAFAEHPEAGCWRETGMGRLTDEINFAFTEEGVHVENSPAYHVGMISNLVRARAVLHAAGAAGEENLDMLYDKALCFSAWMTRPDRYLAYLGDTASYRPNVPEALSDLPSYPQVRWALTGGREGAPPAENTIVYEKSGYAIYRSRWEPWDGHVHIIMKCGFLSRYHRQDDDLNILVHAFGEDWLIDSGLYSHNQMDPIRIYMRSALAHNVPYLKGLEVSRMRPGFEAASLKRMDMEGVAFAVQAQTAMYKGAKATRQLLVQSDRKFQIVDTLNAPKDIPRYWLFHAPQDKRISVSPGAARIVGKHAMLIIRATDRQLPCKVHTGMNGPFPSRVSLTPNTSQDSRVVVFGPSTASSMRFNCTFEDREKE